MKRTSLRLSITALTVGLGASAGALAQGSTSTGQAAAASEQSNPSTSATQAPGSTALNGPVVAVETLSISGTVSAIDPAKREVVERGDKGRVARMVAGENERNFENLKVGDQVTMRYTEALALALAKGGSGDPSQIGEIRTQVEADAARQAAPGGKPGLSAMERKTVVANVFQIDRERGVVTLRGVDGVPVEVKVADKDALDRINLNDQIVIGYQQSAALSIEPG
jgi:hypothetical protein